MRWRTERQADGRWAIINPAGEVVGHAGEREAARSALVAAARGSYAPAPAAPPVAVVGGATRPFESLMVVEGRWTGDDRLIMVDALSWDGLLPMPLTMDHNDGCTSIVGRIDEMERTPGSGPDERFIIGRGVLDLGGELGVEAERMIEGEFLRGVSVDIDNIDEGGVDPETIDPTDDTWWLFVVETARVRALALCPIPAFAEAYITLGSVDSSTPVPAIDGPTPIPAADVPEPEGIPDDIIIIASGHTVTIPDAPPAEWFTEPTDVALEGALTVTDEGRVYGLLAPAGIAHIGRADGLTAPMGNVTYDRFLRGHTPVEGGERVVTGNLTMGCGHRAQSLRTTDEVIEHYDNSCSLVATVTCGERSAHPRGVWIAGALLPGVTADQVRRMMALQCSGHWLPTPGGYELLASLLVPVPGYPMARRQASVTMREGRLVASAVPVRFQPSAPERHPRARGAAGGDCGCGDGDLAAQVEALAAQVRRLEAERYVGRLRSA